MGVRDRDKVRAIESSFNPYGAHSDGLPISAAVVLTASAPADARSVLIQALDKNVRYTLDNTVPTATKGFQLKAGDPPVLIPICPQTVLTVIEEAATADLQFQWGY
jgi:hypothetical protein